ncbi:MAG: PaaI family thioesterase [Deltaproteobacteria bacterium]|nr:MAG: PaaI family thioesterase [Deltaproteobacteria bacterium]
MKTQNPLYRETIQELFTKANFIQDLGVELVDCGPGWCETKLSLEPRHLQQDGLAHAGVQSTLADHSAGAAAGTWMSAEQIVLTVEFKINLLRPARGTSLFCRADVLKPGRRLTIVESEVFAVQEGSRILTAKGTFTLALLPKAHAT